MTTYRSMYTYFVVAFLYCKQFKAAVILISFISERCVRSWKFSNYKPNVEISNILCYLWSSNDNDRNVLRITPGSSAVIIYYCGGGGVLCPVYEVYGAVWTEKRLTLTLFSLSPSVPLQPASSPRDIAG